MHEHRLTTLLSCNVAGTGDYVLYWMQQSQRVAYNHALEFAIQKANKLNLPLVVLFVVTNTYLGANERHYTFMFEGLIEVKKQLENLGITFCIRIGDFDKIVSEYAVNAHSVIFDLGYLHHQRQWRKDVLQALKKLDQPMNAYIVESDVIVPVRKAYHKGAYGAYVIRPHLLKKYHEYRDFSRLSNLYNKQNLHLVSDVDLTNLAFMSHLNIDHSVAKTPYFHGGYSHAKKALETFIQDKLPFYLDRSDPSLMVQSYLSMYLHFGHISPLDILEEIDQLSIDETIKNAFIEQLLVRRELDYNYVYYHPQYDLFEHMSEPWAYQSMHMHENDKREYLYRAEEIEASHTHDRYFNAAMDEMKLTGFMANYMRMYWAKQIIAWTSSYKEAYDLIVTLNNKYFIDGRNPNSYMNIAWCFGKMDRPWPEKAVWGKLRSMNSNGLKRKFDMETYVAHIERLRQKEKAS